MSYIKYLLILASAVTEFVSIFEISSLVGIPIEITSFAVKTCEVTAGIKRYKSINNKKKKKKHDKIVLPAKTKLNSIKVLIFKALTGSNINYDEFVLVNNVLKEYDNAKEKIKNLKTVPVHLFIKQRYLIV